MAKYVALRDFKYNSAPASPLIRVKKGQVINVENTKEFPELEDKMLRFRYVEKPKQKEPKE